MKPTQSLALATAPVGHSMASQRNQLSAKQKQRNLENIAYVRSLLKQKQGTEDERSQAGTGKQTLEDSQEADSGEG